MTENFDPPHSRLHKLKGMKGMKGMKAGADPGFRRGGVVLELRLENRSYPDVHDFSLRPQNSGIYSTVLLLLEVEYV